ncbi:MAG: MoaD/ThiS family protein, partial [Planctomycetota bacterium]
MRVEVRLFATLREGRFDQQTIEKTEAASISELLEDLDIPIDQVGILLVNGKNTSVEHKLASNDVVSLFPAI